VAYGYPLLVCASGAPPFAAYDRLARRLGGRAISVESLQGGVSAPTRLLTYEQDGRTRRAVLRGSSRLASREGAAASLVRSHVLLGVLADEGQPVPEPLFFDPDGSILGEPVLVLDHLEGSTELPPPDVALPAMAELLAGVHRLPTERLDPVRLPVEVDPASEARSLVAALPRLEPAMFALDATPRSTEPVLLHGDFWPGNVLWRDGAVVGLIDWEDAALGDRERDLGTARTEITLALGAEAAAAFRRCYDSASEAALDDHRVDLWTLCSAAGMLLHVSEWGLPPHREQRVRTVAREVLDDVLLRLRRT
jgi:aminoglycoside phosphotransferase (APT) family kinase protein